LPLDFATHFLYKN